jgi:putative drug exporter of the RND superfamily
VWVTTGILLGVGCLGVASFSSGLTNTQDFRGAVESVQGQQLIANAFPAGSTAPTDVVVPDVAALPAVARAIRAVPAAAHDNRLIVPIVLLVVCLILVLPLRAVTLPLLLIATVILSFGAALGISAVIFKHLFGYPGETTTLPLLAFIFLVALGVDYNIFLMARTREETLRHDARQGMLRGLAVTGGVITSAGIVLAGTFTMLATLPLKTLTELGFTIAFGVLLDTFVVRSILVPALVFDLGARAWWPSAPARRRETAHPADADIAIEPMPEIPGRAA